MFLPLKTTLAGSFQEILGYAECIRVAGIDHITGFDFTQSTQTISFTLTDKPLYIRSHHIVTNHLHWASMCLHTVHTHYERPVCIHDSQLDTALRRILKKKSKTQQKYISLQNRYFHSHFYMCIVNSSYWDECLLYIEKIIITNFIMRKSDALLISIICWDVAATWRT